MSFNIKVEELSLKVITSDGKILGNKSIVYINKNDFSLVGWVVVANKSQSNKGNQNYNLNIDNIININSDSIICRNVSTNRLNISEAISLFDLQVNVDNTKETGKVASANFNKETKLLESINVNFGENCIQYTKNKIKSISFDSNIMSIVSDSNVSSDKYQKNIEDLENKIDSMAAQINKMNDLVALLTNIDKVKPVENNILNLENSTTTNSDSENVALSEEQVNTINTDENDNAINQSKENKETENKNDEAQPEVISLVDINQGDASESTIGKTDDTADDKDADEVIIINENQTNEELLNNNSNEMGFDILDLQSDSESNTETKISLDSIMSEHIRTEEYTNDELTPILDEYSKQKLAFTEPSNEKESSDNQDDNEADNSSSVQPQAVPEVHQEQSKPVKVQRSFSNSVILSQLIGLVLYFGIIYVLNYFNIL